VNDFVNDIFFIDTLTGWVVTQGNPQSNDTGYILRTTNGGDSWNIQFFDVNNINVIQFLDENIGYAGGGFGQVIFLKTTDGGINWNITNPLGFVANVSDMYFINKDTGWISSTDALDGGLFKTTNGGINWTQQLNSSFTSNKIHFINSDTGWMGSADANGKLYRTTNGGSNWQLLYTSNMSVTTLFFLNELNGWMRGGTTNGLLYTTNGGFSWNNCQGENAPYDVKFVTDSIGFAGGGNQPLRIAKSTDGGKTWGFQNAQATPDISVATIKGDTNNVWAGKQILIHTTDGGGPIIFTGIQQIGTEIPTDFQLYQNYPNPFNPSTSIKFKVKSLKNIKLSVFDMAGKEMAVLVNEKLTPGEYEYLFEAGNLPSGVYFYSLSVEGVRVDTKKMVLLK